MRPASDQRLIFASRVRSLFTVHPPELSFRQVQSIHLRIRGNLHRQVPGWATHWLGNGRFSALADGIAAIKQLYSSNDRGFKGRRFRMSRRIDICGRGNQLHQLSAASRVTKKKGETRNIERLELYQSLPAVHIDCRLTSGHRL